MELFRQQGEDGNHDAHDAEEGHEAAGDEGFLVDEIWHEFSRKQYRDAKGNEACDNRPRRQLAMTRRAPETEPEISEIKLFAFR